MQAQIAAILPVEPVRSYDPTVWAHFRLAGVEYQLFDRWNFGDRIAEDDPARYALSRVDGNPEDEDSYTEIGQFASIADALAQLG